MKLALFGRVAGALLLAAGLAGCVDMTNDIYITSSTTAKATITQTMSADIYSMIKMGGAQSDDPFCQAEGETLTENADGTATCVAISEGSFTDLNFDDGGAEPVIVSNPDGTVRIGIPTADMVGELGLGSDAESAEMIDQLFADRTLTIRFGGAQILESNLDPAPDSNQYVQIDIPFADLLKGEVDLPEELYAVIRP